MRSLFVALLFLSSVASAQHIRIAEPNGDSANYVRERPRTIVRHDTVTNTEHDTLTHVFASDRAYYSERTMQPILLQPIVIVPRDTVMQAKKSLSSIGIFGYSDFHGSAIAPSLAIDLDRLKLWLYVGAYYSSEIHRTAPVAGISAFAPILSLP